MARPRSTTDRWIVHADESGSPDLHRVDPRFPVFAVAFCLSTMSDYVRQVVPSVTELKLKHFGHDSIVLHEYDIRKGGEPFEFSSDDAQREFMEDLADLMAAAPVRFVAAMIDKRMVPQGLAPWLDGYGVCFQHGAARVTDIIQRESAVSPDSELIRIVAESRGKREDGQLREAFNALAGAENARGPTADFELVIAEKSLNLPGLQLADLAAHPIARHYLEPGQPNRAWDIIREKLVSGPEVDATLVDISRLTQQHPPKRVP